MSDFLMWAGGIIATGIFGLISWVVRNIYAAIKSLSERHELLIREISEKNAETDRDLNDHKVHVAQNYVPKGDLSSLETKLVAYLIRIENKLDGKADK